MRAIVQTRYGSVEDLQLAERPRPTPGPGQVLVAVRASAVHADVWHVVHGRPALLRVMGAGLLRPKTAIPGIDVAGVVEAVGPGDAPFAPGDAVFGEIAGGFQWRHAGAWAEYVAVDADALERIPEGLSFEGAAAAPTPASIALQAVRDEGGVQEGQAVLVNGAGGAVGTFAVQMARHRGATVTAVDRGAKLDLLRRLGAAEVIDFEEQDVAASGRRWDVVIDIASTLTVPQWRGIIAPEGIYAIIGHDDYGRRGRALLGSVPQMIGLMLRKRWLGHLPNWSSPVTYRERFAEVARLLREGAVQPVVDRVFPLEEAAESLRYLEGGGAQGQVVLRVSPAET